MPPNIRTHLGLWCLILGFATSGCSPARTVADIRLMFNPPDRVIFGPEDAERWIAESRDWICQNQSPCTQNEDYIIGNTGLPYRAESYWRPSRSEVRRFEKKLSFALEQARYEYRYDLPGAL